jgi:cold shock CspA family protein/ribosome-associated translation inhibitor RaiA
MQVHPEIKFHGVGRSPWVETYIGERVQRLERFAEGITSCHVTLTQEQASHAKGNRYSVMVEVRLPPNHDLAVRKLKDIRDMPAQLPALINLAFGAIERQLKKAAALRREEKLRADGEQPHGMVEKLFAEGYGFIRTVDDDRQYYFHRNSVLHDDFDRLAVGTEVRFSAEEGDKGPQASSVQIVSKPGALEESPAR